MSSDEFSVQLYRKAYRDWQVAHQAYLRSRSTLVALLNPNHLEPFVAYERAMDELTHKRQLVALAEVTLIKANVPREEWAPDG